MLSIPHLVIIFLVALVVLGPEKLPQVARKLGKAMADFRRITTDFRVQIEDEMQEMERQTRIKKEAEAAEASIATALGHQGGDAEPPGTIPRAFSDPAAAGEPTLFDHSNPTVTVVAPPEAPSEPAAEAASKPAHTEPDHLEKPADGDFHPA